MTTKHTRKPTGYIFYRGASMLNGEPIVAIAITSSSNRKTGNMVQTYILPDNGLTPMQNVGTLKDASVCGDCKHRRGTGGACYVNIGQGVTAVYKAYKNGNYKNDLAGAARACTGRKVRLGTYGDPMAVPSPYWYALLFFAEGHTGYTHQWNNAELQAEQPEHVNNIRALCMASVDSTEEWSAATVENWRTFRVRTSEDTEFNGGEFTCPASHEAGKIKTCDTCMACNGSGKDDSRIKKATPVIVVHGALKKRFLGLTK